MNYFISKIVKYSKKLIFLIAFIVVIVGALAIWNMTKIREDATVLSTATLEKILNTHNLSTFDAVYNGVAQVMNDKHPENIDYYVSYEATITAGIDFTQIEPHIDYEEKKIYITIPDIKIEEPKVDMASLDYIFENESANTATVSEEAYKKCVEDAAKKCENETAIEERAKENAKRIIEALICPFTEQLGENYELDFN